MLCLTDIGAARALILATPSFTDLTMTQYGLGLDLLRKVGLVDGLGALDGRLLGTPERELAVELGHRILTLADPAWLQSAAEVIVGPEDLPADSLLLGAELGLTDEDLWSCVQTAISKIDTARRERIGLAGEVALRDALLRCGFIVEHVSQWTDALGYDLRVTYRQKDWHIEVKTTTSRAQLVIFLSRNEYEVAVRDPAWTLVAVALDEADAIAGVGTVDTGTLRELAPLDQAPGGKWEVARFRVPVGAIHPGVRFLSDCITKDGLGAQGRDRAPIWWLSEGEAGT